MALEPANHFTVTGKDIGGVVDTVGVAGVAVISLEVLGRPLEAASLEPTAYGLEVSALIEEVADSHTVYFRLVLPEVNVETEPVTFSAFAVLTTAQTSIGGPSLVDGPLHLYELRPVAGTASAVRT